MVEASRTDFGHMLFEAKAAYMICELIDHPYANALTI